MGEVLEGGLLNSLVGDYLASLGSKLASKFWKETKATPLPPGSPGLKEMVTHFQATSPVKRKLELPGGGDSPAKKTKKATNEEKMQEAEDSSSSSSDDEDEDAEEPKSSSESSKKTKNNEAVKEKPDESDEDSSDEEEEESPASKPADPSTKAATKEGLATQFFHFPGPSNKLRSKRNIDRSCENLIVSSEVIKRKTKRTARAVKVEINIRPSCKH